MRENFEHNKNLDVVFQHKVAYNIQKIREDAENLKRCLDRKRCEYQGQEGVLIWRDGRLLFKKKYAKTKAYVVNDLAVLEYGYQFGLLSDADARPFQHRISGPLVYERDGIRVELNDKGESLFGGDDTHSAAYAFRLLANIRILCRCSERRRLERIDWHWLSDTTACGTTSRDAGASVTAHPQGMPCGVESRFERVSEGNWRTHFKDHT